MRGASASSSAPRSCASTRPAPMSVRIATKDNARRPSRRGSVLLSERGFELSEIQVLDICLNQAKKKSALAAAHGPAQELERVLHELRDRDPSTRNLLGL